MQNNTTTGLLGQQLANDTWVKTHRAQSVRPLGCFCSTQDTVWADLITLKRRNTRVKTCTATSLQTPPSNILAKQWELATLEHNDTTNTKKNTWVTGQTAAAEMQNMWIISDLTLSLMKRWNINSARWKRDGGFHYFCPRPWWFQSGFIFLRLSPLRRSAPSTIIPLGCGKPDNPRLAIGHQGARDITGTSDWTMSSHTRPTERGYNSCMVITWLLKLKPWSW